MDQGKDKDCKHGTFYACMVCQQSYNYGENYSRNIGEGQNYGIDKA